MFGFLFGKKAVEDEKQGQHHMVIEKFEKADYYKVITADEIMELEEPPFDVSHYGKEDEYKSHLESVQLLVNEYEKNGDIHTLEYNSYEDIERNRDEKMLLDNFRNSYLHDSERIEVKKLLNGKYRFCTNGRHRLYVAKKYDLKLIVHVREEQI